MLLRTIRPLSIAISSNPFGEKSEAKIVKAEELPKMMSIPPGTRASQKLSLAGALIISRSAYEKEFVFSVRTEEGQECWLQSVNAQEMSAWINLLVAVAAEAKSRKRDEKAKEEALKMVKTPDPGMSSGDHIDVVFGVKLDVLVQREGRDVPWVIEKLLDEIERRGMSISANLTVGLDEVGLYRVPGSMMSVKALAAALNAGQDVDMDDPRWLDINVVAGTLKSWLRELPESILTQPLFDKFIMAVGIQAYEDKYFAIKGLVHQLPKPNFHLLKRLIYHLKRFVLAS
jgi:RhoGAP domain